MEKYPSQPQETPKLIFVITEIDRFNGTEAVKLKKMKIVRSNKLINS